ncbi:hypothetical protein A9978_18790 [Pseudomonas sp. UMC65]|uniref:hypothetical protein n=1 Tax=Pseudomonas sp. UMC65 TaxID=1862323 RepID=UPI0016007016|nr:hypothetical protein [Pseudomonas sp. UMC65]MBB1614488.1 hypothetical protein [Pseudomonas sp. UMC65]
MRIKHGGCGTLTYARWKSMMQRCNTPSCGNYKYYGALGVTVCERWHDFRNFRDDMGECPDRAMTLDRIENAKGYEPGNCRWITQAEQNANRTHCVMLEYGGVTKNVADWAAEIGMSANALSMRLRLGWSVEKALTTPLKASPKPKKAA